MFMSVYMSGYSKDNQGMDSGAEGLYWFEYNATQRWPNLNY